MPRIGFAIDVGTTGIGLSMFVQKDYEKVRCFPTVNFLNPQVSFATDVLGRVNVAQKESGRYKLTESVRDAVLSEMLKMCRAYKDSRTKSEDENENGENHSLTLVEEIVVTGNTIMLYLLIGRSPIELGEYPYTVSDEMGRSIHASLSFDDKYDNDRRQHISVDKLYFAPVVSAFVGADIVAGVLATSLYSEHSVLLVDIGTNGEIVLSTERGLVSTSAAAGPAFEGQEIECGMRAEAGAIASFEISAESFIYCISTIGDKAATGICGSGLMDIVSELIRVGFIDETGTFIDEGHSQKYESLFFTTDTGVRAIRITKDIYLTQKDVRAVQLAKSAIRAGIEILIKQAGMSMDRIEKVLVAGNFGKHVKEESLIGIGMLDKCFKNKIEFVGNTSLAGGEMLLFDESKQQQAKEIAQNMDAINLSESSMFEELFIKYLNF